MDTSPIVGDDGDPPMRSICRRIRMHKVIPRTVEVSVSYAMDGDIKHESYQKAMKSPSNIYTEFADAALELFYRRFFMRHPIRKLTLRRKDLSFNTGVYQLSLEMDAIRREKQMVIADCVDEINERWRHAVRRAIELVYPRLTGLGSKANQQFAPAGWY